MGENESIYRVVLNDKNGRPYTRDYTPEEYEKEGMPFLMNNFNSDEYSVMNLTTSHPEQVNADSQYLLTGPDGSQRMASGKDMLGGQDQSWRQNHKIQRAESTVRPMVSAQAVKASMEQMQDGLQMARQEAGQNYGHSAAEDMGLGKGTASQMGFTSGLNRKDTVTLDKVLQGQRNVVAAAPYMSEEELAEYWAPYKDFKTYSDADRGLKEMRSKGDNDFITAYESRIGDLIAANQRNIEQKGHIESAGSASDPGKSAEELTAMYKANLERSSKAAQELTDLYRKNVEQLNQDGSSVEANRQRGTMTARELSLVYNQLVNKRNGLIEQKNGTQFYKDMRDGIEREMDEAGKMYDKNVVPMAPMGGNSTEKMMHQEEIERRLRIASMETGIRLYTNSGAIDPEGYKQLLKYVEEKSDGKWGSVKYFMDKTRQILDAPDTQDDFLKAFIKGHKDVFTEEDFWSLGISGLVSNVRVRKVFDNLREKLGTINVEELSDDEVLAQLSEDDIALIKAFTAYGKAQALRQDDTNSMYGAGQISANAVGFIAQFLLTGGIGEASAAPVHRFADILANKILTKAASQSMKAGAAAKMGFMPLAKATSYANKVKLAAGVGTGMTRLGEAVAAPITKTIPMMFLQTGIPVNYSQKLVETDENGNLKYEWGNAILPAIRDGGLEIYSEIAVEPLLGWMGSALKWGTKTMGISQFFKKAKLEDFWKAFTIDNKVTQYLKQGGFDGLPSELLEEVFNSYVAKRWDQKQWEEFWTWGNWGQMLAGFAPMTVLGGGASMLKYRQLVKKYDDIAPRMADFLKRMGYNDKQVNNYMNRDVQSLEDIATKVNNCVLPILKNKNIDLSMEDRKMIFDFAQAMANNDMAKAFYERGMMEARREVTMNGIRRRMGGKNFVSTEKDGSGRDISVVNWFLNQDGSRTYVITNSKKNGQVLTMSEDGRPFFMDEASLPELNRQKLDDFLQEETERQDKLNAQAKADGFTQKALRTLKSQINSGDTVNLPDQDGNLVPFKFKEWDGNAAIVVDANGNEVPVPAKKVAAALGLDLEKMSDAKTQEQLMEKAARYEAIVKSSSEIKGTIMPDGSQVARVYTTMDADGDSHLYIQYSRGGRLTQEETTPEIVEEQIRATRAARGTAISEDAKAAEEQKAKAEEAMEINAIDQAAQKYTDENGNVDEETFMTNDLDLYLKWSDRHEGRNSQYTDNTLKSNITAVEQEMAKLEQQMDNESNTNKKDKMARMYKKLQDRLDKFNAAWSKRNPDQSSKGALQSSEARDQIQSYEGMGLTREEITDLAMNAVAEAEQAMKSIPKPKISANISAYKKAKEAYNKQVEELQKKIDYWNSILDAPSELGEKTQKTQDAYDAQFGKGSTIAVSSENYEQVMRDNGVDEKGIGEVRDMINLKEALGRKGIQYSVNAWTNGGKVYIFADVADINNPEAMTRHYQHESQHVKNSLVDKSGVSVVDRVRAMAKGWFENKEEEKKFWETTVQKLSGTHAYDGKDVSVLIDEALAFSLQERGIQDITTSLRSRGIKNTNFINLINDIANGKHDSLFGTERNKNAGNSSRGSITADGRGTLEESGAVEGQGLRPAQESDRNPVKIPDSIRVMETELLDIDKKIKDFGPVTEENFQEYNSLKDNRERLFEKAISQVATEEVVCVSRSNYNLVENLVNRGITEEAAKQLRNAAWENMSAQGYNLSGKNTVDGRPVSVLMVDHCASLRDGCMTYCHERRHTINKQDQEAVNNLVRKANFNPEALFDMIETFGGNRKFYENKYRDFLEGPMSNAATFEFAIKQLADEVLAFADENIAAGNNLTAMRIRAEKLDNVHKEIVKFVESEVENYYGQGLHALQSERNGDGLQSDGRGNRDGEQDPGGNGSDGLGGQRMGSPLGGSEKAEGEEGKGTNFSITTLANAAGLTFDKRGSATVFLDQDGNVVDKVTSKMIEKSYLGSMINQGVRVGFITKKQARKQYQFFADLFTMMQNTQDIDLIWAVSGTVGFQPVQGPLTDDQRDKNTDVNIFAGFTANSDPQYTKTVDFTTICLKTQAIIDAMSLTMKKLGRGLSPKEIIDVIFNETHKAGEPVPCPVCYVFSRWINLGGLFDKMKMLQQKYEGANDEEIRKSMESLALGIEGMMAESNETRTDKIIEELVNQLKDHQIGLKADLENIKGGNAVFESDEEFHNYVKDVAERLQLEADKYLFLAEAQVPREIEAALSQTRRTLDLLDEYSWLKNVRTDPEYKERGHVPDDILFDMNKGIEFANKYPLAWAFRTTRGPAMGKAASPYSPLHLGQVVTGLSKASLEGIEDINQDIFLQTVNKEKQLNEEIKAARKQVKERLLAEGASTKGLTAKVNAEVDRMMKEGSLPYVNTAQDTTVDAAVKRMRIQNLFNGQRFQSTSDFRFEYMLDYLLAVLELQTVGGKIQMYTKVPESINFLASCGAEINCSLMAMGTGIAETDMYWPATEGHTDREKYWWEGGCLRARKGELVFSNITGMDDRDAQRFFYMYDNVQPIIVGISDEQMKLCMASPWITFIIPFHASGGTEDNYRSMMQTVGEAVKDRTDYAAYEHDHIAKVSHYVKMGMTKAEAEQKVKDQAEARKVRVKLLSGQFLTKEAFKSDEIPTADDLVITEEEKAIIRGFEPLNELFKRFYGVNVDGEVEEILPAYLNPSNSDRTQDDECYRNFMPAGLINTEGSGSVSFMPYEYWDKTSTIKNADVNGKRFLEYCDKFGYHPRFSGWTGTGSYVESKDFSQVPGYWKTLIDRRMYNRDGSFHEQKPVDMTNLGMDYFQDEERRAIVPTDSGVEVRDKLVKARSKDIVTPSRLNDPTKTEEIANRSVERIEDMRLQAEAELKAMNASLEDQATRAQTKAFNENLKKTGVKFDRSMDITKGLAGMMDAGLRKTGTSFSVTEQEDINEAEEFVNGGITVPGTRFMFVGLNGLLNDARSDDEKKAIKDNFNAAKIALRKPDLTDDDLRRIKKATGWEIGADGKLRYEKSDENFKFHPLGNARLAQNDWYKEYDSLLNKLDETGLTADEDNRLQSLYDEHSEELNGKSTGMLTDYVTDPELFDMYPALRGVVVNIDNEMKHFGGLTGTTITLNLKLLNETEGKSPKGTLLHEIQHAIQFMEGWAIGSNSETSGSYAKYRKSAGEVEARNTDRRQNMTPEERRNSLAKETEDYKRENQLTMFSITIDGKSTEVSPNESIDELEANAEKIRAIVPKVDVKSTNDKSRRELKTEYQAQQPLDKDGLHIVFSGGGFDKSYRSKGVFRQISSRLREILDDAHIAYTEGDKLTGTKRTDGTIHGERRNVNSYVNYVGKAIIDGTERYVRVTVMVQSGDEDITHSTFVSEVEIYNKTSDDASDRTNRTERLVNGGVDFKLDDFFGLASLSDHKDTNSSDKSKPLPRITPQQDAEYRKAYEEGDVRFSVENKNQEIFVSNAAKAVDGLNMGKATGANWLKAIQGKGGLKAGEDKWLGLSDWLNERSDKPVTKQELVDFINENKISIEEVRYSDDAEIYLMDTKYPGFSDAFESDVDMAGDQNLVVKDVSEAFKLYEKFGDGSMDVDDMSAYDLVAFGMSLMGKYLDSRPINNTRRIFTTGGLENKREIALTVPTVEPYRQNDEVHFGDAGNGRAVAWIRFGDSRIPVQGKKATEEEINELNRLDDEVARLAEPLMGDDATNEQIQAYKDARDRRDAFAGKINATHSQDRVGRVLVIDEIQSKRHQDGRERGYEDTFDYSNYTAEKFHDWGDGMIEYVIKDAQGNNIATAADKDEKEAIKKGVKSYLNSKDTPLVSDAPFDKNWHELAFKRMLRLAAEEGYDKIAWTNGEMQSERYDIGNVVDVISVGSWNQVEEGKKPILLVTNQGDINITVNREGTVVSAVVLSTGNKINEYESKSLSDVVGKELAIKLMNVENERVVGDELRIGGEGMKGFYDNILVNFANKYGKKWGSKVEDISLPGLQNEEGWHSMDITPEMKASVMDGQTMFSATLRQVHDSAATSINSNKLPASFNKIDWKKGTKNLDLGGGKQEDYGTFFSITPAQDKAYMDAVNSGDMAKAQTIVDKVAKAAGYKTGLVYHGSTEKFNKFDLSKAGYNGASYGYGIYFTNEENVAKGYSTQDGQLLRGYLNMSGKLLSNKKVTLDRSEIETLIRTFDPTGDSLLVNYARETRDYPSKQWYERTLRETVTNYIYNSESDEEIIGEIMYVGGSKKRIASMLHDMGYAGYKKKNVAILDDGTKVDYYIALSSSQFKKADPVTYDDQGNVIPLSQRFNPANDDVRFSISDQETRSNIQHQSVIDIKNEMKAKGGLKGYLGDEEYSRLLERIRNVNELEMDDKQLADYLAGLTEKDNLTEDEVKIFETAQSLLESFLTDNSEEGFRMSLDDAKYVFYNNVHVNDRDIIQIAHNIVVERQLGFGKGYDNGSMTIEEFVERAKKTKEQISQAYEASQQNLEKLQKELADARDEKFRLQQTVEDARQKVNESARLNAETYKTKNEASKKMSEARLAKDQKALADAQAVYEIARQAYDSAHEALQKAEQDLNNLKKSMETESNQVKDQRKLVDFIMDKIRTARRAMADQKQYDKATATEMVRLANDLISSGLVEDVRRGEMKKMIAAIRDAVGAKDVTEAVNELYDLILDNQLRRVKDAFEKTLKTKATRIKFGGVVVQGSQDVQGQDLFKAIRDYLGYNDKNLAEGEKSKALSIDKVEKKLGEIKDKLDSEDEKIRTQAAFDYTVLTIVHDYQEKILKSIDNEQEIKQEIEDIKGRFKDSEGEEADKMRQARKAAEEEIRSNLETRLDDFIKLTQEVMDLESAGHSRALDHIQEEMKRVRSIHWEARTETDGVSEAYVKDKNAEPGKNDSASRFERFTNGKFSRFVFGPVANFDQILRFFGRNNAKGEGFLFNRFMRGWIEAVGNEQNGKEEVFNALDAKVSEVFGKEMTWRELGRFEKKMPEVGVSFFNGDGIKEYQLSQGKLMYIIMVDRMTDGRSKLRKMGITEEVVEMIRNQMDPRLQKIADWIQDEFLPARREVYNATHQRLFGASMTKVDNYFPLKINKNSRYTTDDLGRAQADAPSISMTVGAIKQRVRNNCDLDLVNADAFNIVDEHLTDMEHWNAFAELIKDLNELINYSVFRNRVKNMETVRFGSGELLWDKFRKSAMIAAGTYTPQSGDYDKIAMAIASGFTGAKIAFRPFTAFKQILSFPAYFVESNLGYLAKSMVTPISSWNWCMKNLPVFRKRWTSRQAGDHILPSVESWSSRFMEWLARNGMTMNAFVDAMTVSIGAKAIYDTKYRNYLKKGFSEEAADRRAKQDAVILYNETQQSNEDAFMSALQKDRTVLTAGLSVFRNSSMGYERQHLQAAAAMNEKRKSGYREKSIEFMTKQYIHEGMDEEQARKAAEMTYTGQFANDAARWFVHGFFMQFCWNLGPSMLYLLFGNKGSGSGDGDDDDKNWIEKYIIKNPAKYDMVSNAFWHALAGPVEGLATGQYLSDIYNTFISGGSLKDLDIQLLPMFSDIGESLSDIDKDLYTTMNDIVNLFIQYGFGVNGKTIADWVAAINDLVYAFREDTSLGTVREFLILMARLAEFPTKQIEAVYIDQAGNLIDRQNQKIEELGITYEEAKTLSMNDLADRYARYKFNKNKGIGSLVASIVQPERKKELVENTQEGIRTKMMAGLTDKQFEHKFAQLTDDAKDMAARVQDLRNRAKEGDADADAELMKIFTDDTGEYGRLLRFKDLSDEMNAELKAAVKAKTNELMARHLDNYESLVKEISEDFDGITQESQYRDIYTGYTEGTLARMAQLDKKYQTEYVMKGPEYQAAVERYYEYLKKVAETDKSNKERIIEIDSELSKINKQLKELDALIAANTHVNGRGKKIKNGRADRYTEEKRPLNARKKELTAEKKQLKEEMMTPMQALAKLKKEEGITPEAYMPAEIFNSPDFMTYINVQNLGSLSGNKFEFDVIKDFDQNIELADDPEIRMQLKRQRDERIQSIVFEYLSNMATQPDDTWSMDEDEEDEEETAAKYTETPDRLTVK